MPACFQLFPKNSDTPAAFQDVDAAICAHFNVPCDSIKWYRGWYDMIGFSIACGKSLGSPELRAHILDVAPKLLPTLTFLETSYRSDAWREIGKR